MIARTSTRFLRKISAYTFPFLLVCPAALPWGNEGHQIVAEIAARKLTLRAQQNIVALLRSDANDDLHLKAILGASGPPPAGALEKTLKTIATWPDNMPGGKGATAPWHFVDIGLFEGPSHISQRCPQGACVSQKISDIVQNLKTNKNLGQFTPPKELRFLVHFLGDIHQPLHCATNADAGGNCIKEQGYTLQFPSFTQSGTQLSLTRTSVRVHPILPGRSSRSLMANSQCPQLVDRTTSPLNHLRLQCKFIKRPNRQSR